MSRSLSHLRRGLLGIALMGSLGFGASQAFAEPQQQNSKSLRAYKPYLLTCYCEDGGVICAYPDPGCPIC